MGSGSVFGVQYYNWHNNPVDWVLARISLGQDPNCYHFYQLYKSVTNAIKLNIHLAGLGLWVTNIQWQPKKIETRCKLVWCPLSEPSKLICISYGPIYPDIDSYWWGLETLVISSMWI